MICRKNLHRGQGGEDRGAFEYPRPLTRPPASLEYVEENVVAACCVGGEGVRSMKINSTLVGADCCAILGVYRG